QTITVNPRDVLRIIHGHEGTTQLLSLKVEGDGGARMAIIRDMQFDPVTEKLVHVDIQEVRADRAITVRAAGPPVGAAVRGGAPTPAPNAGPRRRARGPRPKARRPAGPPRRRSPRPRRRPRRKSKPEATRGPMWWWGSGTRDRSTGTPATTSASASSSISRGSS